MTKKNPDFFLKIGFAALFVLQFIGIVYINLFRNGHRIGFDAGIAFSNAIEIWEQGTLNPVFLREFSNLHFDTAMPFAALLYGITGDIFLSFGIVNIIFSALIAVAFAILLKDITNTNTLENREGIRANNTLAIIVPMCILFSSFVSRGCYLNNSLDNFYSLIFTSAAFWGFRLLTGLCCIKAFLVFYEKKSGTASIIWATIATAAVFICAVSTGFYILVTFIAPLILFFGVKALTGSASVKELLKNKAVYLVILWVFVTLVGRFVAGSVFDFRPNDTPVLTGAADFFSNLQSVYLGYLILLGGIRHVTYVPVASRSGLFFLSNIFIAHLLIAAVVLTLSRIKKKAALSDGALIFLSVIFVNLVIFTLTFLTYGATVFETRYLIPVVVALIALLGGVISYEGKTARVRHALLGCLLAALIISNLFSFSTYIGTTIYDQRELAQKISGFEAGLVYTPNKIVTGNLRVLDTDRVFHTVQFDEDSFLGVSRGRVGGYLHYIEPGSFAGDILLLAHPDDFEKLPPEIREKFTFEQYTGFRGWNMYSAAGNYDFTFPTA
ncbi:MAG: hypothetical protein FWC70_06970 [Defluviitaleaceae bacterium]|nr:hypothetical protein [Defluviitaleaceae bacterium]